MEYKNFLKLNDFFKKILKNTQSNRYSYKLNNDREMKPCKNRSFLQGFYIISFLKINK